MNPVLVKMALEKVLTVNVLVNLVSRRVRQLECGYGKMSRPLVPDTAHLGSADIALREIIEDKMGFDMPEFIPLLRPSAMNRKRPAQWAKT